MYTNLNDIARNTLKELLTLQTYSNFIKNNIGTYTNITDDIKCTLKEIIDNFEFNNNIKVNKNLYNSLSDIAKHTIKEFIAINEYNNNVKNNINNVKAVDYDDIPKNTNKQILNENYLTIANNNNGLTQVSYDVPITNKDITKNTDYFSVGYAVGVNNNVSSQIAEKNMTQNIIKEEIAQGRVPTLSGPKDIPSKDQYNTMKLKLLPNYNRINPIKSISNISDINSKIHNIKIKPYYNERLYKELLQQLQTNNYTINLTKKIDK